MVQKEVTKKTRSYGLIGVLLAVLLVAMIYSYGVTPGVLLNPTPDVTQPTGSEMKTFTSYDELKEFLSDSGTNSGGSHWVYSPEGGDTGSFNIKSIPPMPVPTSIPQEITNAVGTADYSRTNIQVAGVDEADTVKTDGSYLYVIGNNSQVVYVLDANPTRAAVLSKIFLNNSYISGVYLSADGNKLAVIGTQWVPYFVDLKATEPAVGLAMPYWNSGTTFVYVYDLANKASPALARNFTMTGSYVNSRLIGNYIYNIVSESAYVMDQTVNLPSVFRGPEVSSVTPSRIFYATTTGGYYSYTTVACINIADATAQLTNLTIMMGGAGTIYVSSSNIYVTYPDSTYETIPAPSTSPAYNPTGTLPSFTPTEIPVPSASAKSDVGIGIAPAPMPVDIVRTVWQGTRIYRIAVSGPSLTFAASGNVTGNVLNQYAMDENSGYFRIATTSYDLVGNSWGGTQQNNVYVLNMNLNVVGKLEKLGTGENFHSARFVGNRLYMVTFQKTDPLFVIDLSQPSNPTLMGELVMPGYSDYLHPYDETHLIGLGKDAIAEDGTDFAWYQGLKLSLFDVSNINAPKEISKLIIGDRGTNSEALYDPKAFLFDKSRNLLVIPVELYLLSASTPQNTANTEGKVPVPAVDVSTTLPSFVAPPIIGRGSASSQYGTFVWQGAYVIKVTIDSGFTVRGNVSQLDDAAALWNDPSLPTRSAYPWYDSSHYITRALYIGDVLYTISQSRVQLNSLTDLSLIAKWTCTRHRFLLLPFLRAVCRILTFSRGNLNSCFRIEFRLRWGFPTVYAGKTRS